MRKYIFLISFIVLGHFQLLAQNLGFHPIEIVTQKKGVSIRGLSIPNQQTIWASGSGGNIAKSEDGGNTFIWSQVKGYEKRDFRSIHAWNKKEAIIVAVAAPAVILKTKDGGANWVKVYENTDTSMFLDAIDFLNTKKGYVIGDPINGQFYLLQTTNKGDTWKLMSNDYFKESPKEGEAFFASSATNLTHFKKHQYLVSGGKVSRLWMDGQPMDIPILQGGNSTERFHLSNVEVGKVTNAEQTTAKNAANGYAGLNNVSRTTKGVDTTDDIIVDNASKGLVLKNGSTYYRVTVNGSGVLVVTNLGTTKP
ncbi:MAG: hypothetical protein EBV82_07980 [Chitinophagia bacterium]|nr:hypothetical protein [Chitinophagia bacterium]